MQPRPPHQSALRKGRRDIANNCYFVTTTVTDRRQILARPVAAQIVIDCLCWLQDERNIRLMGFVVMPDHLHVAFVLGPSEHAVVGAASRPRYSLSDIVGTFKSYTARRINEALASRGALWQKAYHDHLVRDHKDFETRLSYMHGNPVRKGLSRFEGEYEFSTANTKFAHLVDWAWLDGIGTGRGQEAAPTEPLSLGNTSGSLHGASHK